MCSAASVEHTGVNGCRLRRYQLRAQVNACTLAGMNTRRRLLAELVRARIWTLVALFLPTVLLLGSVDTPRFPKVPMDFVMGVACAIWTIVLVGTVVMLGSAVVRWWREPRDSSSGTN